MAYGKIKADAIIRDNGGSDEEITMATIAGLDSGKASLTGATFTGDVTLNAQQELRLADSDSSNYVALKSPATVASNVTLTLPANDGDADQYLQTNGSGVLSWADVSGGYTWTSETTYANGLTFSSIPSTATEIVLLFDEVDNSANNIYMRLGTSSSFISSGYVSAYGFNSTAYRQTDGFYFYATGHRQSGIGHLKRAGTSSNIWYWGANVTMITSGGSVYNTGAYAGRLDLGGTLTRIKFENVSSGTVNGTIALGYK